jgi:C1A family cysteine protease
MSKIKYGWVPDRPDARDFVFAPKLSRAEILPFTDLASGFPEVDDQGTLGSCTGHGVTGVIQYASRKQDIKKSVKPSRLMAYYGGRQRMGTVNVDSGAMIRDVIKGAVEQGVCKETLWPYDTTKFAKKPSDVCYQNALDNQVLRYERIDNRNLDDILACLSEGWPIVFGWTVYESSQTEIVMRSGLRPMPQGKKDRSVGGHCEIICGHDNSKELCKVRGSWGRRVGRSGYFQMRYEYLTNPNLSDDFWKVTLVEQDSTEPNPKPKPHHGLCGSSKEMLVMMETFGAAIQGAARMGLRNMR